jgi:hypothetical protein
MKFTPLILNIKDSTSNLIFNKFEEKTGNQFDVILFVEWIHMPSVHLTCKNNFSIRKSPVKLFIFFTYSHRKFHLY